MKLLALLFVTAAVCYAGAQNTGDEDAEAVYPTHSRGCIYINGRCFKECEEGTHAYAIGCGHMTPEATCSQPNPKEDTSAIICDYSACYCDVGTVRDTISKKCIPLQQCPTN